MHFLTYGALKVSGTSFPRIFRDIKLTPDHRQAIESMTSNFIAELDAFGTFSRSDILVKLGFVSLLFSQISRIVTGLVERGFVSRKIQAADARSAQLDLTAAGKKIIRGLSEDKLFTELSDEIEEGRELYRARVSPELYEKTNFFDRAVVDIIIKSKGHVRSKIW